MVLTPGGYKSLGKVTRLNKNEIFSPAAIGMQADRQRDTPAPGSRPAGGWVAYTKWMNDQTDAIKLFTANWTVPPEPKDKSSQTIFLFIGLQNTRFILQPVLQWGPSHAGGGSFWSIANWYTDGTLDKTFCSEALPVKPGQSLTAKIECIGNAGRNFTYKASFEGFPQLDIERNDVIELLWVFVVLESYNVRTADNYPAVSKVRVGPLQLSTRTTAVSPAWVAIRQPNAVGEPRANFDADGIDLVF
jgi:hypothetical protein